MNLLPPGLKGVAFRGTNCGRRGIPGRESKQYFNHIFAGYIKKYFDKEASERKLVRIGRWTVIVSMVIAGVVAPSLRTLDQAYQFIQEYVGFISPGVLAIFLLGLFWRRTTSAAALAGTLLTIPVSTLLKFLPVMTNGAFPDFPFLDRMTITFVLIIVVMVTMSVSPTR